MAYDINGLVTLGSLKKLAEQTKSNIDSINTTGGSGIQYVKSENNSLKFFKNSEGSGEPEFTVNFPEELFLDNLKTEFVEEFEFSEEDYPGADLTDEEIENLEGQPVLVLAVKNTPDNTYTYSFINLEALVNNQIATGEEVDEILREVFSNNTGITGIDGGEIEP